MTILQTNISKIGVKTTPQEVLGEMRIPKPQEARPTKQQTQNRDEMISSTMTRKRICSKLIPRIFRFNTFPPIRHAACICSNVSNSHPHRLF